MLLKRSAQARNIAFIGILIEKARRKALKGIGF